MALLLALGIVLTSLMASAHAAEPRGVIRALGIFDVGGGDVLTLGSPAQVTGPDDLIKNGAGILQVAGSSNFTGNLVINGGELRVEGSQSLVDELLSPSRLQGLTGAGGLVTFAYNDSAQKDRIIRNQPAVPGSVRLGFGSVGRSDHSYGLGAVANDLQNYAGLVVKGGQVYIQVNQTFRGTGASPTTLEMTGGGFQLFGGAAPAVLTFSGNVTFTGGTFNGGGFGGAKGTLVTLGDVFIDQGVTVTGLPNLTMQPGAGGTTRLAGTAGNISLYSFVKDGPGTVRIDAAFAAVSLVDLKAGTLALGAADRIADITPIRLSGGTLATGGFSETLDTLTLRATSSIDLGQSGASILRFADSSLLSWTRGSGLLVLNWSAGDQLVFGGNSRGLSSTQLAQIWFVDPIGFTPGTYPAEITSKGEVRPRSGEPIQFTASAGSMTMSWPPGYVLQSSTTLTAGAFWTDLALNSPLTISTTSGTLFYRVVKR